MSQHLSADASLTVLGAGPLGGSLLLGALFGLAILLVWLPLPLVGLLRSQFARLSPVRGETVSDRQNRSL